VSRTLPRQGLAAWAMGAVTIGTEAAPDRTIAATKTPGDVKLPPASTSAVGPAARRVKGRP